MKQHLESESDKWENRAFASISSYRGVVENLLNHCVQIMSVKTLEQAKSDGDIDDAIWCCKVLQLLGSKFPTKFPNLLNEVNEGLANLNLYLAIKPKISMIKSSDMKKESKGTSDKSSFLLPPKKGQEEKKGNKKNNNNKK